WNALAPHSLGSSLAHLTIRSDHPAAPWPRLLIGCGRQSIPVSRDIKRLSGGKTFTVQCQDPRVNVAEFDLVIPPEHDRLAGANVFSIVGSTTRIESARLIEARKTFAPIFSSLRSPRIGVLIGGKSRTHGVFDLASGKKLADQLSAISAQ